MEKATIGDFKQVNTLNLLRATSSQNSNSTQTSTTTSFSQPTNSQCSQNESSENNNTKIAIGKSPERMGECYATMTSMREGFRRTTSSISRLDATTISLVTKMDKMNSEIEELARMENEQISLIKQLIQTLQGVQAIETQTAQNPSPSNLTTHDPPTQQQHQSDFQSWCEEDE